MDCYSRWIVGWAMADHMRADLVIDALEMAVARRKPAGHPMHHSDQGSPMSYQPRRQRHPYRLDWALLTADQAGALLGSIPRFTVLRMARDGRLPCLRIGKHVRFAPAELEDWLTQHRSV